mgnify:CR=1 FL=1
MWEQEVAFWVLALAMAAAAIGVVRTSNIVHAALFLVVVLAGAAGQYLLLVAEFVACNLGLILGQQRGETVGEL